MSSLLVSCATLSQGGASRVVANLSKPFVNHFDNVTIIMWVDKPIFYTHTDSRVTVLSLEKECSSKSDLKKLIWFRKFVKENKPDLILSFLEPFNIRVLLSTIGLRVKTIVAERNDPTSVNGSKLMCYFEKAVYGLADGILVQTETIKRFFDGRLANKTTIIYNPVNLQKNLVGKALTTPKKKRIVSAARLTPQKNLIDLIYAFEIFYKSHPEYSLTLYGEGPQEKELKSLSCQLGLESCIEFPGPSKTIHQDILDANIFALVSDREGMSNSMIEAMCLGLPCICTKVSGAIDLITSEVNGILIDIHDRESLANSMKKLAEDEGYARKIGQNASNLYEMLNEEKINQEWVQYLLCAIKK